MFRNCVGIFGAKLYFFSFSANKSPNYNVRAMILCSLWAKFGKIVVPLVIQNVEFKIQNWGPRVCRNFPFSILHFQFITRTQSVRDIRHSTLDVGQKERNEHKKNIQADTCREEEGLAGDCTLGTRLGIGGFGGNCCACVGAPCGAR